MAGYLSRPTAAARGKFADQYVPCTTCGQPLLDVQDTGHHPTPDCDTTRQETTT